MKITQAERDAWLRILANGPGLSWAQSFANLFIVANDLLPAFDIQIRSQWEHRLNRVSEIWGRFGSSEHSYNEIARTCEAMLKSVPNERRSDDRVQDGEANSILGCRIRW